MTPNVICICPVKDEAAQLDRFLSAASLWATHIILADQGSTDATRSIAARFPKVRMVENRDAQFDERTRQALLLSAARQIPGSRVIFALDADELLTANFSQGDEWNRALASPPGTAIIFDWVNLMPGGQKCWLVDTGLPWGYVDDGREHDGVAIHSARLPFGPGVPGLKLREVKVLHYQYMDWTVMKRKQMWYQCWELLNSPGMRPFDLYRRYHHMDVIGDDRLIDVKEEWFAGYEEAGIDVRSAPGLSTVKWDRQIIDLLFAHKASRFRKLDIWSVDWPSRIRDLYPESAANATNFGDPRNWLDRTIMGWLGLLQKQRPGSIRNRVIRQLFRVLGW